MVVYAISILIGTSTKAPSATLETVVLNWLSNQETTLDEIQTSFKFVDKPREEIEPYYEAVWRLKYTHDFHTLIEVLKDKLDLVSAISWYKIQYHLCMEDDPNYGQCGEWITEASSGAIPEII